MEQKEKKNSGGSSASFKLGAISLAFLIIGYQAALFVHRAGVLHAESLEAHPDTVIVYRSVMREGSAPEEKDDSAGIERRNAPKKPELERVLSQRRDVESFRFNPNTVSVSDLQRLGFSEKQALAIDAYRAKGGRFRRRSDFAKSFVVSDSVYRRLERFIDIPKVDINRADSAEFDTLPGIGGWFASRMVGYRSSLGGYSYPEQLMDIYHFDREKYDGLSDLITCSAPQSPFGLWSLPAERLREHPYIRDWQTARAIVLYREHNKTEDLTVQGLEKAGILSAELAAKLSKCVIAPPVSAAGDEPAPHPAR